LDGAPRPLPEEPADEDSGAGDDAQQREPPGSDLVDLRDEPAAIPAGPLTRDGEEVRADRGIDLVAPDAARLPGGEPCLHAGERRARYLGPDLGVEEELGHGDPCALAG